MKALIADDVARELGRSRDWLYANWRDLVGRRKMPAPIHEDGMLTWSAAQFYAWLDRDLPPDVRAMAAAIRAAEAAAKSAKADSGDVDAWRQRLRNGSVGA